MACRGSTVKLCWVFFSRINESKLFCSGRQVEHVTQLPIGQEPGVAGHICSVEPQLDSAVEIDPQRVILAVIQGIPFRFGKICRRPLFFRGLAQISCHP